MQIKRRVNRLRVIFLVAGRNERQDVEKYTIKTKEVMLCLLQIRIAIHFILS